MASMFVFTACSNTNNSTDDTIIDGGDDNGGNGDDNGGDDNGDDSPSVQTYSHVFNQKDFADGIGGGKTHLINGLEWQYNAITFLGQSSNGVQIGSNKKPQSTSSEPSPVESKSASDGENTVVVLKFDFDIASVKKTRCEKVAA